MNVLLIMRVALRALKVNTLRTLLTMLGIIIGVGAVVTMIAIGKGAQQRVEEQIKSLGSALIIILPGTVSSSGVRLSFGSNTLTDDDAAAIMRDIPGTLTAATVRGSAQIVAGNANWSTQINGITPTFLEVREWPLDSGREFEAADYAGAAKVVYLGQTVAQNLFGDGDPLGQTIRIKKVPFTVVGVLERKGQSLQGQDQDDIVLMPLNTARKRLLGTPPARMKNVGQIWLKVQDGYSMSEAEAGTRTLLRQRHRLQQGQDDDFFMRNLSEVLATQEASSRVLTLLLAAVASVSLVVGGIGIMNIMLVSVTERTREIGLRMAVGAREKDILYQFLIEAVTLSLIGGLIGVAIGVASSYVVGAFTDWRVEISPQAVALAVGFAFLIGVFFGFYPARKASRLQPIEALRYE